jgi:hypothetical protein
MNTNFSGNGGTQPQTLSPIHLLNLQFLVTVREALKADPVQAAYEFAIDVATADAIRHCSDDRLRALSCALDGSIFTLRLRGAELAEILQMPPALRPVFAAVRERPRGLPPAG